ncbi:PREDICTED: phosphoribosylaminoimidazole-succinocarboxamide synthase, chloroplastic isoform X2 [Theobroma cacao]|uniref:phosphoribosylaminoimidazolesuccinocarboxamide synthase n=2 Tax=Theobroma cacao TaxID=3641 RepID=A0AB32UUV6_THECC|nr:PREDICTED: phosphoribosylaminoimidazole-succinocarboxamide synthase, chloroplastic isoform X2 [Theobroma cacao]EOY15365.1 Purin 7 isoform 3 [Theobroma cacao]
MAQCIRTTVNPPKTPLNSSQTHNPNRLFPSISSLEAKPKSIKYPKISLSVMSSQNQSQQLNPSLDALLNSGRKEEVFATIKGSVHNCLSETNLHLTVPGIESKTRGKVLNETSLWWFNRTQHITPNAVVSVPDKNVTIAKKCSVFPVEFVVRGFVTGSTDTSLWTVYKNGVRNYCGNVLPNGLVKNQKLTANILTPTTKAEDHDVPVTPDEIIGRGLMTQADFDEAREKALSLFEYGQCVALEHGLILVDTKYEFGKDSDGSILLIDEVHTPDSSRYWIANSYEERFQNGLEPENVDKEFLRLWFKDNCNPYEDEVLPDAPEELVCELAWRYIFLYETITKSRFEMPLTEEPIHDRISQNVSSALLSLQ